MIKVQNLILPLEFSEKELRAAAAKKLRIPAGRIDKLELARLSIDARKKTDVHYVCAVTVTARDEADVVERAASPDVARCKEKPYVFPPVRRKSTLRPVVVGMGPAGLFAALHLARAGVPVLVIERGQPVEKRSADVEHFWQTGRLNTDSNVQFGEGGAGTFSDGKLTTGIGDPRVPHVFRTFTEFGAPRDILWQHKPHIGTDVLREIVARMRKELLSLGCEIRFNTKLTEIICANHALKAIKMMSDGSNYELPCDTLILAPGHSARDTFEMLLETGLPMEKKPFAIGLRVEHLQKSISAAQFGAFAEKLPPADYKLACHLPNGRSAYTFCVCPGGQVVAAASEEGRLVTNGMSLRARDGQNCNGAFLVGLTPDDFAGSDPLAGVRFQQHWERQAFLSGGENFYAPVQTMHDFLAAKRTQQLGRVTPTYRPGVMPSDLSACLPEIVADTLRGAAPIFERSLRGFADPEAVLTAIETRSSSPVRILRNERCESSIKGIFPCGEGAGYAGGITSAAVDGIRVAEAVAARI
ncbi:MAG: NAD(P)/FAD-dependent oxidoreductase [Oscillospiraceae bacterium]|jgi:uncharacterized FAD-dependent dehydrogenase